jgi:RecA/RadA recombinase
MATLTMTAPDAADLSIETAGADTVLEVHFEQPRPARDARRIAQYLTALRMPGVEGVDAIDTTVVVSFDPGTMTRSHLELLIQDAARHL